MKNTIGKTSDFHKTEVQYNWSLTKSVKIEGQNRIFLKFSDLHSLFNKTPAVFYYLKYSTSLLEKIWKINSCN